MVATTKNSTLAFLIGLSLCSFGCDEEKPEPPKEEPKQEEAEAPEPEIKSPPHLVIGEDGPSVRGASVEGGKKTGTLPTVELDKFKTYLADEKEFIEGKELRLVVDRKAKRGWVSAYLSELGALGASKIIVATETRGEFKGELEFIPPEKLADLPDCVTIGQVTEHNGSAIWKLKGGTASERGPGLGGPDLSMAAEHFGKNYKNCESNVFVTDADVTKEWGFIFDFAAAAAAHPEAGVTRALLPAEPQTAGRKVKP